MTMIIANELRAAINVFQITIYYTSNELVFR